MAIAAIHGVRLNHGVIGVEPPWLDETKRRRSGVVIEQRKIEQTAAVRKAAMGGADTPPRVRRKGAEIAILLQVASW
jgi:hypothetical protein